MLSSLRSFRRESESKIQAKEDAAENKRRNREVPFLKAVKYARHGERWTQYECSACGCDLHKSARFCVGCGAWFSGRKKK